MHRLGAAWLLLAACSAGSLLGAAAFRCAGGSSVAWLGRGSAVACDGSVVGWRRCTAGRAAALRAGAETATEDETWAARRACARLSDSHIAGFRKDGFVTLRQAVPPAEFADALAGVEAGSSQRALEQLAAAAPPRALACLLMGSTRSYLLGVAPTVSTRVPGLGRFQFPGGSNAGQRAEAEEADCKRRCAVLLALESIDVDECPELLFGSHLWPPAAAPRNLAALSTWTASLQRGDCLAVDLDAAWRLPGGDASAAPWHSKAAVMLFGGDGAAGEGVQEVWWDDLGEGRGYTPTTVVQWSKGVPPPDEQHYA